MAKQLYWVSHERRIFGFLSISLSDGLIDPNQPVRVMEKQPLGPLNGRAPPEEVLQHLTVTFYELLPVGKDRDGRWVLEFLGDPADAEKMEGFYRSP